MNEVEDSDDLRPAQIAGGDVINVTGKSSLSLVKTFVKNSKDIVFFIVLLATVAALGHVYSEMKSYEQKYESAAKELADEDRLKRNHDDQLKVEMQVAQMLVTLTRCKP